MRLDNRASFGAAFVSLAAGFGDELPAFTFDLEVADFLVSTVAVLVDVVVTLLFKTVCFSASCSVRDTVMTECACLLDPESDTCTCLLLDVITGLELFLFNACINRARVCSTDTGSDVCSVLAAAADDSTFFGDASRDGCCDVTAFVVVASKLLVVVLLFTTVNSSGLSADWRVHC